MAKQRSWLEFFSDIGNYFKSFFWTTKKDPEVIVPKENYDQFIKDIKHKDSDQTVTKYEGEELTHENIKEFIDEEINKKNGNLIELIFKSNRSHGKDHTISVYKIPKTEPQQYQIFDSKKGVLTNYKDASDLSAKIQELLLNHKLDKITHHTPKPLLARVNQNTKDLKKNAERFEQATEQLDPKLAERIGSEGVAKVHEIQNTIKGTTEHTQQVYEDVSNLSASADQFRREPKQKTSWLGGMFGGGRTKQR